MKITCQEDRLNRKRHFEPLTTLIENLDHENFVMTVSAPYGGGKTFFIEKWQEYLHEKQYKTLCYNAWENDVADNPLMSFIASFEELGLTDRNWKDFVGATAEVISDEILSHPEMVKTCVDMVAPSWGYVGEQIAKVGKKVKEKYQAVQYKTKCKNLFIEQVYNEKKKKEQIEKVKKSLKTIVEEMPNQKLIIFIDDLDRCNPAYAIKFLEYIKHLFDVEGCIFVLAVDEDQLKSSVEVIYGNKNGEDFLAKIIDFKFKLPKPAINNLINYVVESKNWGKYFMEPNLGGVKYTPEEKYNKFIEVFNLLAKIYKLSIRDILHICQDLDIIFKTHSPTFVSPVYILLVYVIENYKYKIAEEMKNYLKGNITYISALRHYCNEQSYKFWEKSKENFISFDTISEGYVKINTKSEFDKYLYVLASKNKVEYPYNYEECYFNLSFFDFDKGNYNQMYEPTKNIIEDIFNLDESRKELLARKDHEFTIEYLDKTANL